MTAVQKLRILNGKLEKLLNDPQPGLFAWKTMLSEILTEMSDYAGHGMMSTFPELLKVAEEFIDDEKCRLDHHGNCQTHGLQNPCEQMLLRKIVAKAKGKE